MWRAFLPRPRLEPGAVYGMGCCWKTSCRPLRCSSAWFSRFPWLHMFPDPSGVRAPARPSAVFLGYFLSDIVVANFQVARIILDPGRVPRPRFVVPLALHDPLVVTVLAGVISLTPGTVSTRLSEGGKTLVLHCLDVADEQALLRRIRTRYEAPLREIFQC